VNQTFLDYYRCPQEFARGVLDCALWSKHGATPFEAKGVCRGGQRDGAPRDRGVGSSRDLTQDVAFQDVIPASCDPDEIVEHLRLERYYDPSAMEGLRSSSLAKRLYYCVRPFLSVGVRRHLQKFRLADWGAIRFPHWPVDTTVEQVHETMLRLCLEAQPDRRIPFIWFWPEGFRSCAIVTHDVEAEKGRAFCRELMDLDEGFEIRSSFQLVPEERYDLSAALLEEMRFRGFEINVHDLNHDGKLFSSEREFFERVGRINQYAREFGADGFRSGALYRNVAWYRGLKFSYDMSVPNVAHLDPQRGGCCTVMPYFIGEILELPVTTIQDYSLFHILEQYSADLWKQQIGQIIEQHGLASVIVHPDYILKPRAQSVYKTLLRHLADLRSQEETWITLPGEVNRWWRARSEMSLVRRGHNWVIEGPEKHRARIAYALLRGHDLAYELRHEPVCSTEHVVAQRVRTAAAPN
jgi:hypothetical protein